MTRNRGGVGRIGLGWLSAVAVLAVVAAGPRAAGAYEVWVTDQSDSAKESGGILYVYDGARLAAAPGRAEPAARLDFGAEAGALCRERTGRAARRPHMLLFTRDHRYAVLAFLSGQVLVLEAAARQPIDCVSVGHHLHAAWPTPDGTSILAAGEKHLVRVRADYERRAFAFDASRDVLDLAALEGADLPDNAPICPITEASGRYAFVTLRGGGLVVADLSTTPIRVVQRLPREQIRPAGCGGVQVGQTLYVNSGGGTAAAPLAYEVYALDLSGLPAALSAARVLSREGQFADAHGMAVVGGYLWSVDRAGNRIDVLETATMRHVATVELAGAVSDDPAPDLIDVAPDGRHVFVGLRGPRPLTGNHPEKMNAKGSTPGVGVVRVTGGGRGGVFEGIARITNPRDGGEAADPHGLAVRR